jgi:hypothetical protein
LCCRVGDKGMRKDLREAAKERKKGEKKKPND